MTLCLRKTLPFGACAMAVVLTTALAACQTSPKTEANAQANAEGSENEAAEDQAPEGEAAESTAESDASGEALSNEERLAKAREYANANKDQMFEVEPLTEEDKRLIDADPETLTEEERKARAYALRKKILQDPDSPQAKALKEAANNIVDGNVEPNLNYKDEGQSTAPPQ